MKRPPTENFYDHTRRRCLERYGVDMSAWEWRVLTQQIKRRDHRRARLVCERDRRQSFWLVLHRARWILALYDRAHGVIATVYPLHTQFENGQPVDDARTG
jgi:hypothetical protein